MAPKPVITPVPPKSAVAPKPPAPPKSTVAPKPAPKFEVVEDDDEPAPPPKSAAKAKAAPQPMSLDDDEDEKPKKKKSLFERVEEEKPKDEKPKKKKSLFEKEDEEEEQPQSKRRRDDDDEEDERPRNKKRRRDEDDEDEDDRPRSKRRRDDDDDDEDDRPRKKRRRDDDDDDDDDWHQTPKKKGPPGFANAKTGVLLLNISFWLYGVSLGLITFFIFLLVVGAFEGGMSTTTTTTRTTTRNGVRVEEDVSSSKRGNAMEIVAKLPGILGVGNWLVAAIGFGFCLAGPVKARGMAITATSLAGAHILLLAIAMGDVGGGLKGFGSMGGGEDAIWLLGATTLPVLDTLLPIFLYGVASIINGTYILLFLAAGCEIARMIFAMLLVKRLAETAKDYEAAEKAQMGLVGACVAGGGSMLIGLGLALLVKAGAIDGLNSARILGGGSILLIFGGFTLMTAMPIFSTMGLWKTLARKTRAK